MKKLQDTTMADAALAIIAVCGLSFYCSAAADAAMDAALSAADAAMTVVCGSSFCCSAAAVAAMTADANPDFRLKTY